MNALQVAEIGARRAIQESGHLRRRDSDDFTCCCLGHAQRFQPLPQGGADLCWCRHRVLLGKRFRYVWARGKKGGVSTSVELAETPPWIGLSDLVNPEPRGGVHL